MAARWQGAVDGVIAKEPQNQGVTDGAIFAQPGTSMQAMRVEYDDVAWFRGEQEYGPCMGVEPAISFDVGKRGPVSPPMARFGGIAGFIIGAAVILRSVVRTLTNLK